MVFVLSNVPVLKYRTILFLRTFVKAIRKQSYYYVKADEYIIIPQNKKGIIAGMINIVVEIPFG